MKAYQYIKIDQNNITDEQFRQVCLVENSSPDGYSVDIMKEIWVTGNKNDNFACIDGDKIVAHITYNPQSQRRNGSIYMVNLTVLPEYKQQGIATNLILCAVEYYIKHRFNLPMSTSVDKDNIPAINLYKKVGFEIKEPICDLDQDDEQYIMDADLNTIKQTILNKK